MLTKVVFIGSRRNPERLKKPTFIDVGSVTEASWQTQGEPRASNIGAEVESVSGHLVEGSENAIFLAKGRQDCWTWLWRVRPTERPGRWGRI